MSLWKRIRSVIRRETILEEIADEYQFHLEMKNADLARSGLAQKDVGTQASRQFGASLSPREAGFDVRSGGVFDAAWGDLRFAVRILRKTPARTAVLIVTVALGIGVNTAVFSILNSILLRPLPYADSNRLVALHQADHQQSGGVSYPHFLDWRASSHSFEAMAVYLSTTAAVSDGATAVRLAGATVSASLFPLLGVSPLRGRLFRPEEDRLGERTVLIGEHLWRTRFNQRADILDQRLILEGVPFQIVGVIPSKFAFPVQNEAPEFWTTVAVDAEPSVYGGTIPTSRGYPRYDAAIAKLRPGVSMAQAQAEMSLIARTLAGEYPKASSMEEIRLVTAVEDLVGNTRPLILILYCSVFCVFLVACSNVATLLLVSAVARAKEFALRAAIGANSSRLVRQLLLESGMLVFSGGGLGVFAAWLLLKMFIATAPPDTPRLASIHLDGLVLLYAVAISVVSGIVCGLVPAMAAVKIDLLSALKGGNRNLTRSSRLLRPGTLMICGQLAVSMVLTCAATLLGGSFLKILHAPRGFDPHHVLTASLSLPVSTYPQKSDVVRRFYSTLVQNLQRAPGVESASIAQSLPLSGDNNSTTVEVTGAPERVSPSVNLRFVGVDYFQTLQIPVVSGRSFSDRDTSTSPACAIVNQAFVRRFLAGRAPGAALITLGWGGGGPKRIVGVVGDIRHNAADPAVSPEVYVPHAQFPVNDMAVLVRTASDPDLYGDQLRKQVWNLDHSLPVDRIRSLDGHLMVSAAPQKFLMQVLAFFAGSTILLAAIGMYGVLSYSTTCRTHEFGIRMALGSRAAGVLSLVLKQGMTIAFAGVGAGLALAWLGATLLTRWLYDVSPTDPRSLAVAAAALLLASLTACWLPARRATRVDPLIALRTE